MLKNNNYLFISGNTDIVFDIKKLTLLSANDINTTKNKNTILVYFFFDTPKTIRLAILYNIHL